MSPPTAPSCVLFLSVTKEYVPTTARTLFVSSEVSSLVVAVLTPCPRASCMRDAALSEHPLDFSLIYPRLSALGAEAEVILLVSLPQCPGQGLTLGTPGIFVG